MANVGMGVISSQATLFDMFYSYSLNGFINRKKKLNYSTVKCQPGFSAMGFFFIQLQIYSDHRYINKKAFNSLQQTTVIIIMQQSININTR